MIVGIDLGTTNSLCSVFQNGEPALIPNSDGKFLTPSVVGLLEDGQVIVGDSARELRVTNPERTASCFKRLMGTEQKIEVANQSFTAPELSSLVLKSLKSDAETFLKEPVDEAVISVPAYFNDIQRRATKLAGELAGLKVSRIINEPTAAALTYGFHDRNSDKSLLVIDLGGGTFDVTLMEIFEGTLEILSTAGENFLGGEDFTDRLVAKILNEQNLNLESAELKYPLMVSRLREECEKGKKLLSEQDEIKIRVPEKNGLFEESAKKYKLNRKSFQKITERLLERISQPILKVLRDAQKSIDDIGDIIFVGGATRMQLIDEFIQEKLRKKASSHIDPDQVVALGAAVQAALMNDDNAVDDMIMTDVCPFSLGVEVSKEFGERIASGYYLPIIHRNTTIPVSKERPVETIHNNQQEMLIKVYQGESRKIEDNLYLGELSIQGIPRGPKGKEVLIRFTYDLNGILEVEVVIPETGKKKKIALTNHAKDLNARELKQALSKIDEIKFYPRDDMKNRKLVLFCERMVGEVAPQQRDMLESMIDQFEHAMSSGDKTLFEVSRQSLLETLNELGISYNDESENN